MFRALPIIVGLCVICIGWATGQMYLAFVGIAIATLGVALVDIVQRR